MNLFACFSDFQFNLSFSGFTVDVCLLLGNDSLGERCGDFLGVAVFSGAEFLVNWYAKAYSKNAMMSGCLYLTSTVRHHKI